MDDQDAFRMYDYERIQELMETMLHPQIKNIEAEIKKAVRGFVNENLEREHDLITNNAYFGLSQVPFVEESSGKIDAVLA